MEKIQTQFNKHFALLVIVGLFLFSGIAYGATVVFVPQGGTGVSSMTDGGVLLGSGTAGITAMSVLSDGAIIIGDGTTDPVANTAFTSSTGLLKHESGGIELNISSISTGDVLGGASAGVIEIIDGGASSDGDLLTIQADGTANWETPAAGSSQWTKTGTNLTTATALNSVLVGTSTPSVNLTSLTVSATSTATTHLLAGLNDTGIQVFSFDDDGLLTLSGNIVPTTDNGGSLGISGTEWSDVFLNTGAVINFEGGDVTVTHASNALTITGGVTNLDSSSTVGNLTLANGSIIDSSGAISFGNENLSTTGTLASGVLTVTGAILPNADDGGALGASGTEFSDLFLNTGGVINWEAGDVTLTHSSNLITLGGGGLTAIAGTVTLATVAGAIDAGGATSLEIPNGTAPTVDATGEIAIDTTSDQLIGFGASAKKVYGNGSFYPAFTYSTSTAWSATTTIPLGTAFIGETWNAVQCYTDVGTLNVTFSDGTNDMNVLVGASTTAGTVGLTSNNTFTASEKREVQVGTPATAPTSISCTLDKSYTAD